MKYAHAAFYFPETYKYAQVFQIHPANIVSETDVILCEAQVFKDNSSGHCCPVKAFSLYRRALVRGCTDGVNAMAEIYMMLGDYKHSARLYASSVKYGYRNASDAQRALDYMLSSGKIDVIPEVNCEPDGKPTLDYLITYRP